MTFTLPLLLFSIFVPLLYSIAPPNFYFPWEIKSNVSFQKSEVSKKNFSFVQLKANCGSIFSSTSFDRPLFRWQKRTTNFVLIVSKTLLFSKDSAVWNFHRYTETITEFESNLRKNEMVMHIAICHFYEKV